MLVRILGQGKLATKQFSNSIYVDRWLAPNGAAQDAARNLFSMLSARLKAGRTVLGMSQSQIISSDRSNFQYHDSVYYS